jgi:hypothetical protein
MPVITTTDSVAGLGGYINARLSSALRSFAVDYWPPHHADTAMAAASLALTRVIAATHPRILFAVNGRSYLDDYYYRIHVIPAVIDVGNLVTSQMRTVDIWNAWPDQSHTLTSFSLANGNGITVTAPGALPLVFNPLQQRQWTVSINTLGDPVINTALQWTFTGLSPVQARVIGNRLTAWMLPPDWGNPVVETLAWLTDVEQALDGSEYREPLRDTPRRQWEFDAIAEGQDRQRIEAAIYDWTSRNWALPVWPDVTWLASPLPAGSLIVPVTTGGRDFVVGGLLMLWTDTATYELAQIDSIASGSVTLSNAILADWPAQTRVYPCRVSRLTDPPKLTRITDRLTTTSARFECIESSDWPAIAPPSMYLGLPVLEDRPNESSPLTASYARQLQDLDGDVGLVFVDDITGKAWPLQSHAWLLAGSVARNAWRSQMYWLQGRGNALWVPSWADDVSLAAPVLASDSTLIVQRIGVARHLAQQAGRRHLRIELFVGTVLYRRVITSSQLDAATEQLALDSATGVAFTAADVRQISWMMLCRGASDTVQIAHINDNEGVATVAANWAGIGAEEP